MTAANKNIVITPNIGNTTVFPTIVYTGNANVPMTQAVADDNSIFWANQTGQLFSISNNVTSGTIFSVNDISGYPFITVGATGNIMMSPLGGANVGIGTSNVTAGNAMSVYGGNLFVSGTIRISNTAAQLGGIQFADGTLQTTAGGGGGGGGASISISNNSTALPNVYSTFSSAVSGTMSTIYTATPNGTQVLADNVSVYWSNSTGQLFSISNNLTTGTIFSVTDISGIPFFNVNASGNISLLPFGGANVGIGTASPTASLQVIGTTNLVGAQTSVASIIPNTVEPVTIFATAPPGNVNVFLSNSSVTYYTGAASANFNVNITFSNAATLNSLLTVGQSVTCALMVLNGVPAYFSNVVTIDGSNNNVSTYWLGNAAPAFGTNAAIDSYSYSVIKTGNATFTVLASQANF